MMKKIVFYSIFSALLLTTCISNTFAPETQAYVTVLQNQSPANNLLRVAVEKDNSGKSVNVYLFTTNQNVSITQKKINGTTVEAYLDNTLVSTTERVNTSPVEELLERVSYAPVVGASTQSGAKVKLVTTKPDVKVNFIVRGIQGASPIAVSNTKEAGKPQVKSPQAMVVLSTGKNSASDDAPQFIAQASPPDVSGLPELPTGKGSTKKEKLRVSPQTSLGNGESVSESEDTSVVVGESVAIDDSGQESQSPAPAPATSDIDSKIPIPVAKVLAILSGLVLVVIFGVALVLYRRMRKQRAKQLNQPHLQPQGLSPTTELEAQTYGMEPISTDTLQEEPTIQREDYIEGMQPIVMEDASEEMPEEEPANIENETGAYEEADSIPGFAGDVVEEVEVIDKFDISSEQMLILVRYEDTLTLVSSVNEEVEVIATLEAKMFKYVQEQLKLVVTKQMSIQNKDIYLVSIAHWRCVVASMPNRLALYADVKN